MAMVMKFKRRRQALTDYKKRLSLVKGNSDMLIVRKSNRRILGQVSRFNVKGDQVLFHSDSNELKKLGWPSRANKPTAYLTGLLLAKKVTKSAKDQKDHILNIGLASPSKGSIPFVFAKGCKDGGMKLRGQFDLSEDLYNCTSISKYAQQLKSEDQKAYERQFGSYLKEKINIDNLNQLFNQTKEKIMKS